MAAMPMANFADSIMSGASLFPNLCLTPRLALEKSKLNSTTTTTTPVDLEKWQEISDRNVPNTTWTPPQHPVCPHCGRRPHCGRGGYHLPPPIDRQSGV